MDVDNVNRVYNKYNPISNYVIRPALKLADAHNHPIRGGLAAASASGIAHYALMEAIGQTSDYLFGTNFRSLETKMVLTEIPTPVHILFGINMLSNIGIGLGKHFERKINSAVEKSDF